MTEFLAPEPAVDADAVFRNFMRHNLGVAADQFQVMVTGRPRTGWLDRSISAPVRRGSDELWLRVVSEEPQWTARPFWTGNEDANTITGIAKPRVLEVHEWPESTWRHQRAELMTRLAGHPCSATDVLRHSITVPDQWWDQLKMATTTLAAIPVSRSSVDQDKVDDRVRYAFGDRVQLTVKTWETAHGDLHWANLMQPEFGLVDWEMWGRAPAGTDAATLYCFSLLEPATAALVRGLFADQLDTPDGRTALLYVIARLRRRVAHGDFVDLHGPLAGLAAQLDCPLSSSDPYPTGS